MRVTIKDLEEKIKILSTITCEDFYLCKGKNGYSLQVDRPTFVYGDLWYKLTDNQTRKQLYILIDAFTYGILHERSNGNNLMKKVPPSSHIEMLDNIMVGLVKPYNTEAEHKNLPRTENTENDLEDMLVFLENLKGY